MTLQQLTAAISQAGKYLSPKPGEPELFYDCELASKAILWLAQDNVDLKKDLILLKTREKNPGANKIVKPDEVL